MDMHFLNQPMYVIDFSMLRPGYNYILSFNRVETNEQRPDINTLIENMKAQGIDNIRTFYLYMSTQQDEAIRREDYEEAALYKFVKEHYRKHVVGETNMALPE